MQNSSDNYANSFGYQWNLFRSTQLDSHSGVPISFQRFWRWTGWKPKEIFGAHILEAGSGAGRFTEVMLDAGSKVFSFDYSEAIFANKTNNQTSGEVQFAQADIRRIPCMDSSFDYVFCYGVLQHLPESAKALQELVRVLKPNGRISVDYYIRSRSLDPFNQPKYFWRRWSTKMNHQKLLKIIRFYIPIWLPFDSFIRRIPIVGPKILAILRIPCWNYTRSGLSRKQRKEWAILDTFDALSAVYDKPLTRDELQSLADSIPELINISITFGSNGLVLNGSKSSI